MKCALCGNDVLYTINDLCPDCRAQQAGVRVEARDREIPTPISLDESIFFPSEKTVNKDVRRITDVFAINNLLEELHRNPDDIDKHIRLAGIYEERKMYKEAENYYRKATTIESGNVNAILALSNFLFRIGLQSEAEGNLIFAMNNNTDEPRLKLALGRLYTSQGKFGDALILFDEAIELGLDTFQVHLSLGMTLLALEQTGEALTELKIAYNMNKKSEIALSAIGVCLDKLGDDSAERVLKDAQKLSSRSVFVLRNLSVFYFKNEEYQKAEPILKKVLTGDSNVNFREMYGYILWQKGIKIEASRYLTWDRFIYLRSERLNWVMALPYGILV